MSALFPRPLALVALLVTATVVASRGARAQVAGVVAPVPAAPLYVDYPAGAQGEGDVLLIVTVNADGSVRAARVDQGVEPFASAAVAAARTWRFVPAMRDGVAIPAMVRVAVDVRPPEHDPEPEIDTETETATEPGDTAPVAPAAAPGPPTPPRRPTAPQGTVEVTARDVREAGAATGSRSLRRGEVRLIPGAFGDPFRAIDVLPGVTPIASGIPFFYVRGAPPGNTGYFIDGVRVPLLYHIGLGPSVIHPSLIERVDLHAGGYPARYGRYVGGIVAGETRAPAEELRAEASLRLVDAGAMVETPFDGGRGSALVGGRYSYTGAVISMISPTVELDYWDYQGRFGYDVSRNNRVSVLLFGAHDFLGHARDDGAATDFSTTFHRADLRWDHRASARTHIRQAITLGLDRTTIAEHTELRDRMVGARLEITHRVDAETSVRGGADGTLDVYDVEFEASDFTPRARGVAAFLPTRRDVVAGCWLETTFRLAPALEVTPGLRADVFGSSGDAAVGIDPRLASRLFLGDRARLVQAFGIVHQPPAFLVPVPGIAPGHHGELQTGVQSSAALEVDLPLDISASSTVFRNVTLDLSDPLDGTRSFTASYDRALAARSTGDTVGLEIYLRRRLTRRLGGFFSYTLSRSVRRTHDGETLAMFDRTHVLNGALGYDLGAGVRAGARGMFYTGGPTPERSLYRRRDVEYPSRFPSFARLDLRFEKRWSIGRSGWVSAVLEGQNVTLSRQVTGVRCGSKGCFYEWVGPVTIPSIGLEAGF